MTLQQGNIEIALTVAAGNQRIVIILFRIQEIGQVTGSEVEILAAIKRPRFIEKPGPCLGGSDEFARIGHLRSRVERFGADAEHDVDFRLITATHCDLKTAVGQGTFRADLYHRIAQLAIKLPPLRDREGDIAYLAQYFLAEIAAREDEPVKAFTAEAMAELQTHTFPGNVRELQNFLLRCVLLARDEAEISLAQLREAHASMLAGATPAAANAPDDADADQGGLREMVGKAEADILARCFRRFHGNQAEMALALEVPRRTLSRKLARYGICAGDESITETQREEV
ncbi:sigma 54-interacting transcriptional regulator [Martelella radicis]|uniref:Transcriptional regulator with GAF, ATPase, and Fis domain n=1 Tax=Martelella radicis TaxID=1397476 RepID=A0A7W6KNY3_9HYPH|nr:sigma 54-interacting transcriptional regulator [Martelella radicis]MBB4124650.1 transcriptional regulator with GAF, ATPase, and Fis domain [Martelella radicis]